MSIQKITVVDHEAYTAWCFPTKRLVHHQFHRYSYGEEFQTNMAAALEAFIKYNCFKWLSDDRKFAGALHQDDWEWGAANFTPQAVEAGWRFYAMVLSDKAIAVMSQNLLVENFAAQGVKAKLFTKIEEAEDWIDSKGTLGIDLSSTED